MDNPILDFTGLPRFAEFQPQHITPAIDQLLGRARDALSLATAPSTPTTWEGFVEPLTDAIDHLDRAWKAIDHLNAVVDTPAWRAEHNLNVAKLPAFFTELGQNPELYRRYKALQAQPDFSHWSQARRTVVENALRDFRLSGADLPEAEQKRFAQIEERLAELATRFSQNGQDATDAFQLDVEDSQRLRGIPEDVIALYAANAKNAGKQGWRLTLQFPSYGPALRYADDRSLRAELYEAYFKRASEFGPAERDNTPLIRERLKLLVEQAQLLGYRNYAELSLVRKMADSPSQAIAFVRDLAAKARPYAQKDQDELKAFAQKELGLASLEAWDGPYASEKLRAQRYDYSAEEIRPYLPEPQVRRGLFGLLSVLFGVELRPASASVWHPSVQYFELLREGNVIAGVYLDLFAREGKRGGAWMNDVVGRRLRSGRVQLPVAHVVCNFSSPVGDRPALLTHGEVETLFHEFGHALQHTLTTVDELAVAGINGVEWDAVELPSQMMENFAWEWEILKGLSGHFETGEPLPRELYDKMLAAKNYQSGLATVRQIEFGLFDLLLHSDFDVAAGDYQALLEQVRLEVAVAFPPSWNRFANGFDHIFGGGYAAGYYSYKWAEVLSADAYSAFEEAGGANAETGRHFLEQVLAVGGSRPSAESFRAFRGREPSIEALLRHSGMLL